MAALSHSRVTRWAVGDGGLAAPGGDVMDEAAALEAMPELGLYEVELGGDAYPVERVGSRYCTVADIRAYAAENNDGFADPTAYPDDAVLAAIQAAEEAIEDACGRSFCRRRREVALQGGALEELPEVDVSSLSSGTLVGDRQAVSDEPATAVMEYGAPGSERSRQACIRLAATYLRPRAGAENARGASVDGVYVSYELATGGEGSWTGIPYVDAFIASAKSRRAVVM